MLHGGLVRSELEVVSISSVKKASSSVRQRRREADVAPRPEARSTGAIEAGGRRRPIQYRRLFVQALAEGDGEPGFELDQHGVVECRSPAWEN